MSVTIDVQLNEQWRKDIEQLRAQFKSLDGMRADLHANIRPAQRRIKQLKKELHALDKKRWTTDIHVKVNRKHIREQIQKAAAKSNISLDSLSVKDDAKINVDEKKRKRVTARDKYAKIWYDEVRRKSVWPHPKNGIIRYQEVVSDSMNSPIKSGQIHYNETIRNTVKATNKSAKIWYDEVLRKEIWAKNKSAKIFYDEVIRSHTTASNKRRKINYNARLSNKETFATKLAAFTSALNNSNVTTLRFNMRLSNKDRFLKSVGRLVDSIEAAGIAMPMNASGGGGGQSGSSSGGKAASGASSASRSATSSSSTGGKGYFEGAGMRGHMKEFGQHASDFRNQVGDSTFEVTPPSEITTDDVMVDGDANIDYAQFRDSVVGQSRRNDPRSRRAFHHMSDRQVVHATMQGDSEFGKRQRQEAAGRRSARSRRRHRGGRGVLRSIRRTRTAIRGTGEAIRGMNSALSGVMWSILPTNMYKWYSILAMLLPLIFAMAVQLAGVATAMLSVVGAGAAMMGLGLLGFGDNMAESMELARRELRQFKRDMFNALQPVTQEFAPITTEILGTLSFRIEQAGVVDALSGLTEFEGAFQRAIDGILGWITRALDAMVQFQPMLEQLAMRFGSIMGDRIISFLSWLVTETYENQEAFISFAGALGNALFALYNIIMMAAKLVSVFGWILDVVAKLTGILREDLSMAFLYVAMLAWMAVKALLALSAVAGALQTLGLASTLQKWSSLLIMVATKALFAAKSMGVLAGTAAALMGILTLGAGLVAIGAALKAGHAVMRSLIPDELGTSGPSGTQGMPSGNSMPGGGGRASGRNPRRHGGGGTSSGPHTVINVQGDLTEESSKRLEDKISQGSRSEINIDKERNPDNQ